MKLLLAWLLLTVCFLAQALAGSLSRVVRGDAVEEILLQQTSPSPVDARHWQFVTGLPIARGALADTRSVRLLDAKGREIPAQFEPLAYWSPARNSIKWLRVVFTAPTIKGKRPEYRLTFGKESTARKISKPLAITEDEERVSVDTGAIRFTLDRRRGGILSRVVRRGRDVYVAGPADGFYVQDAKGTIYRAALDTKSIITVEETGPLRAVIRVENWNVGKGPSGARLNKNITRYYAYAGLPCIEVDWTFVITADTDLVQFKDIGLRLSQPGKNRVGTEGKVLPLDDGYLLQKKSDLYVVRQKKGDDYVEIGSGTKAPGWIQSGDVSITMRDFCEMFPKELEAQSSAVVVHAWPGHGEYNQDWFIEPTAPPSTNAVAPTIAGSNGIKLNPSYFSLQQKWHHGPLLDFRYPSWWRQRNITGSPENPGWLSEALGGDRTWEVWSLDYSPDPAAPHRIATGTSRTQQLLLDFSQGKDKEVAARRALFLAQPHLWLKNPQQLADSEALGPMDLKAAESWDEPSRKGWRAVEAACYYGMWIWGNMPEYFSKDGLPGLYRQVNGSAHYGYFNTHWLLYACTARPEHLRFAQANTAHWRDVAVIHYSTPELEKRTDDGVKIQGAVNFCNFYPWRGAEFTFYSGVFPLLMDYYLTGNRFSLETADLHAHSLLAHSAFTGFSREFGGNFKTALDWYAHSWEPAFGKAIDEGIHWIVTHDPTTMKSKEGTPLNWTNFMPQYLDMTRYPDIPLRHRDELIEYVKKWSQEWIGSTSCHTGYPGQPGNMLAAAWFATGDRQYLQPFERMMLWSGTPRDEWLKVEPPGVGSGIYGAIYFDQVLYAYAAWRQAYEKGVMVESEALLSQPPPPARYMSPSHIRADRVWAPSYVLIKEANKPWRMRFLTSGGTSFRLSITAPDGTKVVEAELPNDEGWHEYGLPAAAQPGVYRLEVAYGTNGGMYRFFVGPVDKHMLCANESVRLNAGSTWSFQVPRGARQFKVRGADITILDPRFNRVEEMTANEVRSVSVPDGMDDKLWHVRTSLTKGGEVRLEGIPPYLTVHPAFWFPMP